MTIRIKLKDLLLVTEKFDSQFGELTVVIIDENYHFVNHSYKTKLQCELDSRFDAYTDENGNDYILFETRISKHKLYPITIQHVKIIHDN